jgi:hypothetical protein
MLSFAPVLLVSLFCVCATTDARSIQQDVVEPLVNGATSDNEDILATLTNYRHRFAHSPNVKALRWALTTRDDPINYCELCHLVVPVVSPLFARNCAISFFCRSCV